MKKNKDRYKEWQKEYREKAKEEKERLILDAEIALMDMNFVMALSESNGGPIVMGRDTAEKIVEILKKVRGGGKT